MYLHQIIKQYRRLCQSNFISVIWRIIVKQMLSLETQRLLSQLFLTISEIEQQVEQARIQLCYCQDFQAESAFYALDLLQLGKLGSRDLRTFLESNSIQCNTWEASWIIKQYDSDGDAMLSFFEFQNLVLPATDFRLKDSVLLRPYTRGQSPEAIRLLANLLERELSSQRRLEACRVALNRQPDFSASEAFQVLDRPVSGFADRQKISVFLASHSQRLSSAELDAIIRRTDTDSDGMLRYREFMEALMPNEQTRGTASYILSTVEQSPRDQRFSSSQLISSPERTSPFQPGFSVNRSSEKERASPLRSSFRVSSPSRISPYKQGFAVNKSSPRGSPRRSSPLRQSPRSRGGQFQHSQVSFSPTRAYSAQQILPARASPTRRVLESSPRRSSPLRQSPRNHDTFQHSYNSTFAQAGRSSPRRSSPLKSSNYRGFRSSARSPSYQSPPRQPPAPESPRQEQFRHSIVASPRQSTILNESRSQAYNTSYRASSPLKSPRGTPVNFSASYITDSPQRQSFTKFAPSFTSSVANGDIRDVITGFAQQIELARNLENLKNELAVQPDFNLIDAFRMFDIEGRGFVTSGEFERGLSRLGIYSVRDEIFLMVKHFSRYEEPTVRYSEFCEMICSKNDEYARVLKNRAPSGLYRPQNPGFSLETVERIKSVIRGLIEIEVSSEKLRQKLHDTPVDLYNAFRVIDRDRNGYISLQEFHDVLHDHGIIANRTELRNLLDRYDKDKDGRVSLNEFLTENKPKSPRKY